MARERSPIVRLLSLTVFISMKFADTTGQITSGPSNVAAQVGTTTYLNCTANNIGSSNIFSWSMLDPDSYTTLYISTQTDTTDPTNFGIDINAASGQYNLIVRSVTLNQGTKYWCEILGSNNKYYGELVAVSPLRCPTAGQQVMAGDTVIAMCSVDYSGYMNPKLVWTDSSGVSMSNQGSHNTTRVESYLNFTATPTDDMETLTCTLSFSNSLMMTVESTVASNIPTYTQSCTTYYLVTHGVSEIQFEPVSDTSGVISTPLAPGDQINCTSDGRPQPNYSWQSVTGNGGEVSGEWLAVTDSMATLQQPVTYTCRASNAVSGQTYTVERNVTFTVVAPPSTLKSSSVEPWVIAVAVVVPLVVIIAAVVIGFCCYKQRKSKAEKGTKVSTPFITPATNGPPPTTTSPNVAPRSAGPSPYQPAPGRSYQPNGAANPTGYGDLAGPSLGGSVSRLYAKPAVRGTSRDTSVLDSSSTSSRPSTSVGRGTPAVSMLPDPRAAPRAASVNRDSGPLPPAPRTPSVISSTGSRTSTGSSTSTRTNSTNFAPITVGPQANVDGYAPMSVSRGGSRPTSAAGSGIGRPVQPPLPPAPMAYRPSPDRSRSPSVHGSLQGSIV